MHHGKNDSAHTANMSWAVAKSNALVENASETNSIILPNALLQRNCGFPRQQRKVEKQKLQATMLIYSKCLETHTTSQRDKTNE